MKGVRLFTSEMCALNGAGVNQKLKKKNKNKPSPPKNNPMKYNFMI